MPRQRIIDLILSTKACILKLGIMSRLEELEQQIAELNEIEMQALREWFERRDAELWDRQIESDAKSGKLAQLAENALRDHQSGRSTKL